MLLMCIFRAGKCCGHFVTSCVPMSSLLCLGAHVLKAYGSWFVYLCMICMTVTRIFLEVAKNQVLANAVQAQRDNLRFLN